jgi:hypothetical protein
MRSAQLAPVRTYAARVPLRSRFIARPSPGGAAVSGDTKIGFFNRIFATRWSFLCFY